MGELDEALAEEQGTVTKNKQPLKPEEYPWARNPFNHGAAWWVSQGFSPAVTRGIADPFKRASETNAFQDESRRTQQLVNQRADDRYWWRRQNAPPINQREIEEGMQRTQETEKKRQALKGPGDWMRYMTEIGEPPSWIGYWLSKNGG